jgi:hypothetical protein
VRPAAFVGDVLRDTLTGPEPPGPYTWFAALTVAGTITLPTVVPQTPFTIRP